MALGNIPENLLSSSESDIKKPEKEDMLENGNPLDLHRLDSQEPMSQSGTPTSEEIDVAPGEGKLPTSILSDDFCEKLASRTYSLRENLDMK